MDKPKINKMHIDMFVDLVKKMHNTKSFYDPIIRDIACRVEHASYAASVGKGVVGYPFPPKSFHDEDNKGGNFTFSFKWDVEWIGHKIPLITYEWQKCYHGDRDGPDSGEFPIDFLYDEDKLVAFEQERYKERTEGFEKQDAQKLQKAKNTIKRLREEFPGLVENH